MTGKLIANIGGTGSDSNSSTIIAVGTSNWTATHRAYSASPATTTSHTAAQRILKMCFICLKLCASNIRWHWFEADYSVNGYDANALQ